MISALISKCGSLFGLIIYQAIAAFLLGFVFFLIENIKYEFKLNSTIFSVVVFALLAAIILVHGYAAAHNLIMLMNFLTF